MTLTIDMATKTATPKTRKLKVNNFVLVLKQFLEKHNLMADSTPKQLSEYAPKLDALLPDWMACRCVNSFLPEALEMAKYCTKIGDVMDIFTHYLDLGPKNDYENEIVDSGSHQSQFCVKLAEAGVSSKIINTYAKDPKLIQESNKIQKKQTIKRMANPDRIPTYFSLANVSKRIQNINVFKIPTREDLVDIIVMLSMRPAETKKLSDPVFTGKGTYYGSKHASRIHGSKKLTPQHLKLLSRIAMRQESDRLDAGDNYTIGDTESEESDFEPKISNSSKPQI
ncbi:12390_t:CDS:2 [Cetraspora pellucida]|uniref:12390_t:CDS:1 n=1 Tax=Cetraspora pellucida TaxID=1433469 RepID=A0A9N8ZQP4_9GLOM|nr:12390_t:CDS:2 [Cetraspora pellucida]